MRWLSIEGHFSQICRSFKINLNISHAPRALSLLVFYSGTAVGKADVPRPPDNLQAACEPAETPKFYWPQ
jgi:hypothetical protein